VFARKKKNLDVIMKVVARPVRVKGTSLNALSKGRH
jgi:hypothetical protein